MNPRTLVVVLPVVFVLSVALGYSFAPQTKLSTPNPTPIPPATASPPEPETAANAAPAPAIPATASRATSKGPATADDVFNALSSQIHCERSFELQEAISRLDVPSLQSVIDQIDSVERNDQFLILPRVIDRLMDLDPQRALSWLETNAPTYREGSVTFITAFDLAFRKDPDGARRMFESVAPGDRRNAMGAVIARNMALKDPAAARKFLETFPNGSSRDRVAAGYVTGLATSNPETAIAQAIKWREGASRKSALTTAFVTLAAAGQGQALTALNQITNERERGEILGCLASRARLNEIPALAEYCLTAAREHPKMVEWFDGIERVAFEFARINPKRAIEWAKELPEEQRKEALSSAISQWSWSQPEAAIEWTEQNASSAKERQQQLDDIYRGWLKKDFPKAQAWAEKLPPGPEQERANGLIVSQLATKGQHSEALDLLQRLPAKQQGDLATQVAGNLVWKNPAAASRWLGSIEADNNSAPLFGRVASSWAEQDFKAAANWLGSIPAGVCRDQAVAAYASEVARLDPAAAIEWAATTSNEITRVRTVGEVLGEWQERDLEAARQWLDRTTVLPADRKAALKEYFK